MQTLRRIFLQRFLMPLLLSSNVSILHAVLAVVHALAAAAWFGSMFYSLLVLQPRARVFFETDRQFEEFVATLSQGARWKVLSAFALVLFSGVSLIPVAAPHPLTKLWLSLIVAKSILFVAALCVFCHASWRLWPARIFASPDEAPAFQRRFRRIGLWMITLVGLNLALGVIAHAWRFVR